MWQGMKIVLLCTAKYLNRPEKQCRWNMCVEKWHQSHAIFFVSGNIVVNTYGFSLYKLWKTVWSFRNVTLIYKELKFLKRGDRDFVKMGDVTPFH